MQTNDPTAAASAFAESRARITPLDMTAFQALQWTTLEFRPGVVIRLDTLHAAWEIDRIVNRFPDDDHGWPGAVAAWLVEKYPHLEEVSFSEAIFVQDAIASRATELKKVSGQSVSSSASMA